MTQNGKLIRDANKAPQGKVFNGEYGRRLKVIKTPDGPREYHVTKGWRS